MFLHIATPQAASSQCTHVARMQGFARMHPVNRPGGRTTLFGKVVHGISASALVCRGLRQPSHGLHGRPRAPACHTHVRWAAEIRNPSSREHLWTAAFRSAYTTASSAVVYPIMSLRSSHLVGDHCIAFGVTAVTAVCGLCHEHVFPSCPEFGSAPRVQAAREHRWRHIEHLMFDRQCIPGLDTSVAPALLR